jgi:hypothetical protein
MVTDGNAATELASQQVSDEELYTPYERVANNDLLMRTIFGFVDRHADLLNCMTASKGFFDAAVRHMYKSCSTGILSRIECGHCNDVSEGFALSGLIMLTGPYIWLIGAFQTLQRSYSIAYYQNAF